MGNLKNTSGLLIATLTGAVIGSALAVLYAPRSGKETRKMIKTDVEITSRKLNDTALDFKSSIVRNMERHGDGVGYLIGSVIARNTITIKEIIRALEKELDSMRTEQVRD